MKQHARKVVSGTLHQESSQQFKGYSLWHPKVAGQVYVNEITRTGIVATLA